jgi:hypothetical protein
MCAATAGVMNMWPGRAVTFVDSTSRERATAHPHRRTHRRRTQDAACAHAHGHAHETRSGRARSRGACSASLATLTGRGALSTDAAALLARTSVGSIDQASQRTTKRNEPPWAFAPPCLPHLERPSVRTFVATWQITTRTAPMMGSALPTCACKGAPPLCRPVLLRLRHAVLRWNAMVPSGAAEVMQCRSPIHPSSERTRAPTRPLARTPPTQAAQ